MIDLAVAWTFIKETDVPEEVPKILLPDEEIIAVYKTVKDLAIFTNSRLIVRDAPVLAPKKVETYVLPYKAIQMWSTEKNGAILDFGSDVELWTQVGRMKISLKKDINLSDFEAVLSRVLA